MKIKKNKKCSLIFLILIFTFIISNITYSARGGNANTKIQDLCSYCGETLIYYYNNANMSRSEAIKNMMNEHYEECPNYNMGNIEYDDEDEEDDEDDEESSGFNLLDIWGSFENWVLNNLRNAVKGLTNYGKALTKNIIFPEKEFTIFTQVFEKIKPIIINLSLSLIVLSALLRGFKTYILWKDGNPEENPIEMVFHYIFAIAMLYCFDEIYTIAGNVVVELMEKIENSFNGLNSETITSIGTSGKELVNFFISIAFYIVFIYQYLLALFNTLKKGIELFILRLGSPLAAINLIQTQSSTFNQYISNIIKIYLQILMNIILLNLSLSLTIQQGNNFGALWGIAGLMLLNHSGEFISGLIMTNNNGGAGAMQQLGGLGKGGASFVSGLIGDKKTEGSLVNGLKNAFGIK